MDGCRLILLRFVALVIPDGTTVAGTRGDTHTEAGVAPAGGAAVATPRPKGGSLPSGGGRRGWWVNAVRRGTRTRPPPPSAANHAMETTQFISQPNATWEAVLDSTQAPPTPRPPPPVLGSLLLLSKKKVNYRD